MTKIIISGASDDQVHVMSVPRGVPGTDEYNFYSGAPGDEGFLVASDGSVVSLVYSPDNSGCWRVALERQGAATYTHVRTGDDDLQGHDEYGITLYSDVATLDGDIAWVRWFGAYPEIATDLAVVAQADPEAIGKADAILKAMSAASEGEFDLWWKDLEGPTRGVMFTRLAKAEAQRNAGTEEKQ